MGRIPILETPRFYTWRPSRIFARLTVVTNKMHVLRTVSNKVFILRFQAAIFGHHYVLYFSSTEPRRITIQSSCRNTWRSGCIALQNDEIWSKKFHCVWFDPVEHTADDHTWPLTHTDSVLYTLEDHVVLQSLWSTTIHSIYVTC